MAAASPWWDQPTVQQSALSAENEMPYTRARSDRALSDLTAYLAYNLKRRTAIEVTERRLTPEEREQFRSAKFVEVNKFIAARAFEALPESAKPSKSQAIRMRWILTWKTKDDGSRRPKARAMLLGYQDPKVMRGEPPIRHIIFLG